MDQNISGIREFFEQMGVKTRLSDYQLTAKIIDEVAEQLIKTGYSKLGEHQDITPEVAKDILALAI